MCNNGQARPSEIMKSDIVATSCTPTVPPPQWSMLGLPRADDDRAVALYG